MPTSELTKQLMPFILVLNKSRCFGDVLTSTLYSIPFICYNYMNLLYRVNRIDFLRWNDGDSRESVFTEFHACKSHWANSYKNRPSFPIWKILKRRWWLFSSREHLENNPKKESAFHCFHEMCGKRTTRKRTEPLYFGTILRLKCT